MFADQNKELTELHAQLSDQRKEIYDLWSENEDLRVSRYVGWACFISLFIYEVWRVNQ